MVMTDRDTSYEERADSNRIRRQKDSQEPSSSQVNNNEKDAKNMGGCSYNCEDEVMDFYK